jgi:hypothetical protein
VLAGLGAVIYGALAIIDTPGPTSGAPALSIAHVSINMMRVPAYLSWPGTSEHTPIKFEAPTLDLLLRNTGSQPALLTGIVVTVTQDAPIVDCLGAGSIHIGASYAITIPERQQPDTPQRPQTIFRSVAFEVRQDSLDRIDLSLGPRWFQGMTLYTLRVRLLQSPGSPITIGPLFALTYWSNNDEPLSSNPTSRLIPGFSVSCFHRNEGLMLGDLNQRGLHAPALLQYLEQVKSLLPG